MKTLSSDEIREQLQNKSNDRSSNESKSKMVCPAEWKFSDEVVKIADDFKWERLCGLSIQSIGSDLSQMCVPLQRVMRKIHPGAIVLMHPTSSTAEALDTMIKN